MGEIILSNLDIGARKLQTHNWMNTFLLTFNHFCDIILFICLIYFYGLYLFELNIAQ